MPTYHYHCSNCTHDFSKVCKMSESASADCPHCKGPAKQVIHAGVFHLKGTAWYEDGYEYKDNQDKKE